ncbi:hypothetical protein [Streptomyces africanus]|uniref:hypothetical protein n=1 Tax=Streptomyces africanus TaxID=231024 RepID=UPI000A39C6D8|nr:hypothetical protein [Streptomyces africanus]
MTNHYPDWLIRYEGPGFCKHSSHDSEHEAYESARHARQLAEKGEGVGITDRIGQGAYLRDVRSICVLRRHEASGEELAHSWTWRKSNVRPDALMPRPDGYWDGYTA